MNLKESLQSQLHDQFATNDNDKAMRIVSFISNTTFVLTGYGLAAWNLDEEHRTLFIAITLAACFVLSLLTWLCVNFGYSTRRDQFIIKRIRENAMKDDYEKIIGSLYNPSGKTPMSYMVSYYFILFIFLNIAILGIYVTSMVIADADIFGAMIMINLGVNLGYFLCCFNKYSNIDKN